MTLRRSDRRRFLASGVGLFLGSIAGCIESRSPYAPPMVEDRPTSVYVPSHYEEMQLVGIDESGPYSAGLSYSYPHRFWLVSGRNRTKVPIRPKDSVHLMLTIWDTESGRVLPGLDPVVTVEGDSGPPDSRVLWPMLSQRSSFHYGDNLQLDGDGTYRITVDVAKPAVRLVSDVATRLEEGATFSFEFPWQESGLDDLPVHTLPDHRRGTQGALSPMDGDAVPVARAPAVLPGKSFESGTIGEMAIEASIELGESSGPTLVVSPRTPHNRFPVPMVGLEARVPDDTDSAGLMPALDSRLGIHYRAALADADVHDWLEISVTAPPQLARHEGYETAFSTVGSYRFRTR